MSDLYSDLSDAVITGNIETTKKLVNQALAGGDGAQTVLDRGLLTRHARCRRTVQGGRDVHP